MNSPVLGIALILGFCFPKNEESKKEILAVFYCVLFFVSIYFICYFLFETEIGKTVFGIFKVLLILGVLLPLVLFVNYLPVIIFRFPSLARAVHFYSNAL